MIIKFHKLYAYAVSDDGFLLALLALVLMNLNVQIAESKGMQSKQARQVLQKSY